MRVKNIQIINFRNLKSTKIIPGVNFNLFYGLNGHGKTNILEAIFLLGSPKSFRNAKQQELVMHDEKRAVVKGEIESQRVTSKITLTLEQAGRRVEIDGKMVGRASELHGKLNSVVFSPYDTGMVRNSPDSRRRYLDRAVYMADIRYLNCWHNYHRILKQRNHLLKKSETSSLDTWTDRLATAGAEVMERRLSFVSNLDKRLKNHYSVISDEDKAAEIAYQPEGIKKTMGHEIKEEFIELLDRNRKNDEKFGSTSIGPHRDDVFFLLDGRPLKTFGSQGEQKSFVLALKMAELEYLEDIFGETPLFLLDDMSSELDTARICNLFAALSAKNMQVFITATEKRAEFADSVHLNYSVFRICDGNPTYEEN